MQFSALSNSPITSNKKIVFITWLLRVLLGVVFLYSGFTKAVDPWGGQYKIADYFQAWNFTLSDGIYLTAGCILSGFEFIMGTLLLTGSFRRLTALAVLVFTSMMTGLTLYIWIADPVADCGCFGDAIILSNSVTFWKNTILLAAAGILFVYSKRVRPLIHHRFQWLVLVFTAAYVITIQLIGYHIQPLVDYRPYPTGSNLKTVVDEYDDTGDIKFIYEKDGVRQSFGLDSLPDDSWTFVERVSSDKAVSRPGLTVFDGDEDVTSEVITGKGREFILTVTNPSEHKLSRSEMANRLKAYADSTDATMIAVVALPPDSVESWIDYTGAGYDVYTAEDTDLKMLVRGEAGLMMLDDGIIKWKVNLASIDPYFPSDETGVDGVTAIENSGLLTRLTVTWLLLLFATYLPSRFYRHWYRLRTHIKAEKEQKKEAKKDVAQINNEIKG